MLSVVDIELIIQLSLHLLQHCVDLCLIYPVTMMIFRKVWWEVGFSTCRSASDLDVVDGLVF